MLSVQGQSLSSPGFSRGLRQLSRLQSELQATDAALTQAFANWDAYYHRADGILASLTPESFSLEELRQRLLEAWPGLDKKYGRPVRSDRVLCKELRRLNRAPEDCELASWT